MLRSFAAAALVFALTACSAWPDTLLYPSGYTNHDQTPIATPHGYSRSYADEQSAAFENAQSASQWRDAIALAVMPIQNGLNMHEPVAVVPANAGPLSASAVNYARDMLVKMGYLVALPMEAGQSMTVGAVPAAQDGHYVVTATISRGDQSVASNSITAPIGNQITSGGIIPGLTRGPAVGPAPAAGPYDRLN